MQSSESFLNKSRKQGDKAADRLLAAIFSEGAQATLYTLLKMEAPALLKQPQSPVKKFLTSRRKKPVWFDERRLVNGQRLFKQYALEMMTLLGAMALPYCYAASPGNKALYLSDKMRNAPGKRLMDTASFVIAVLTPGSLDEQKLGHMYINKVRLTHALSRYYIKKHPEWDMAWGLPINQEDMAGTNLAFSYIVLLGLQQSGFVLSQKEKEDFIFLWRYIGYQLYINEDLLPASFTEAARLTHIIRKRNLKKTPEGITLTLELLNYYKTSVPPWKSGLIDAQVRHHLGNEVADYVGITRDPFRDAFTSWMSDLHSLRNMLTIKESSYRAMQSQHLTLKKKLASA